MAESNGSKVYPPVDINNEKIPYTFHLSHKHGNQITEEDINDLKAFIQHEQNLLDHVKKDSPSRGLLGQSIVNNSSASTFLREATKLPDSLVSMLKNEENALTGICITLIGQKNPTEGVASHIGVAWELQKKGLGTQLLSGHVEILRENKVEILTVSVWEASKRLLDKIGLRYESKDNERPNILTVTL